MQQPPQMDPTNLAVEAGPAKAGKTQGRVVWEQFSSHKAALIGGTVLILMYIITAFAGFLAPYGVNEYRRSPSAQYHPPTTVHWRDAETGRLTAPYIYLSREERDPLTRQRIYVEDVEAGPYQIQWFVRRPQASYSILGIWRSDLHLFGVEEPARIFLLGTNNLGKDVFSRILYGGQISLTVGILAVWVALFFGLFFGGLAGFYGKWVDDLIMRFIEILAAIPDLFLLIILLSLLRDPRNPLAQAFGLQMNSGEIFLLTVIVLGFIGWGGLARVIRGLILSLREQEYAQAARALGLSELKVLFKHLLPATASYVIVNLTLSIPGFILVETGLSFIGLGPSEVDTASWGMLLRDATNRGLGIQFAPWLLLPGIPIVIAILCWNLVGDGLRDAFDPKRRTA